MGKIAALLPSGMSVAIFKFPNLLADILTAYLLWRLANPTFEKRKLWVPVLLYVQSRGAGEFHTMGAGGQLSLPVPGSAPVSSYPKTLARSSGVTGIRLCS